MTDNFEFDDVKKLRKSLLIVSTLGIFLAKLVKFSIKGSSIDFLGFSLPISDATFLPNYIGYLILFFLVALIIRFSDDSFKKSYEKHINFIVNNSSLTDYMKNYRELESVKQKMIKNFNEKVKIKSNVIKYSVFTLDIIFPIVLGLFALVIIYFKL